MYRDYIFLTMCGIAIMAIVIILAIVFASRSVNFQTEVHSFIFEDVTFLEGAATEKDVEGMTGITSNKKLLYDEDLIDLPLRPKKMTILNNTIFIAGNKPDTSFAIVGYSSGKIKGETSTGISPENILATMILTNDEGPALAVLTSSLEGVYTYYLFDPITYILLSSGIFSDKAPVGITHFDDFIVVATPSTAGVGESVGEESFGGVHLSKLILLEGTLVLESNTNVANFVFSSIAIQSNERVVLCGEREGKMSLIRFVSDISSLDITFGELGVYLIPDEVYSITILSDDSILLYNKDTITIIDRDGWKSSKSSSVTNCVKCIPASLIEDNKGYVYVISTNGGKSETQKMRVST